MASFFSLLRYSFGNEDWRTEEMALNIQPQDHVLCITASGDRPLNLFTRACQRIVCVDANPAQNHLLELKATAMRHLKYDDYVSFLGACAGKEREKTLQRLLPHLSPAAAKFWHKNIRKISKGILYQGTAERFIKFAAKAIQFIRGKKVKQLFAMDNLEEQRKFVREEWDSYFWRKIFDVFLNPLVSRWLIKDPGLANIGSNIKPGRYIYGRIQASLERELVKKHLLLSLLFKGQVYPEAFPPYLTANGTEIVKTRLSSLDIQTTDIISYLSSLNGPTFDAFSLSDVASYLSHADFIRLLKNILRTAKPGARFCLRQFLSSHEIPPNLQPFFIRDRVLERRLERQDNCFVYRFFAGTIASAPVSTEGAKRARKKYRISKALARR